jgi:hypothetical protein
LPFTMVARTGSGRILTGAALRPERWFTSKYLGSNGHD